MFYDQDGDVCEPCLSCPEAYAEDIWYSLICKAKKCPYESNDIETIYVIENKEAGGICMKNGGRDENDKM